MAEETMEVVITWLTNNIQYRRENREQSFFNEATWRLAFDFSPWGGQLKSKILFFLLSSDMGVDLSSSQSDTAAGQHFQLGHCRHHFWIPNISGVEPQQVSCFFQEEVFHLLHHLYQLWYMLPRRYLGTFCLLMMSCLQMAVSCLVSRHLSNSAVILTISGPANIQCLRPSGLSWLQRCSGHAPGQVLLMKMD